MWYFIYVNFVGGNNMASKQERENRRLLKKMNKQRKKQGLPPLDELPTYDLNEPTFEERQQEAEVVESIEVAEPAENVEVIEEDADARFIAEEEPKAEEQVQDQPKEERTIEQKAEAAVKEAEEKGDSLSAEELETIIRKAVQDELENREPAFEEVEEDDEEEEDEVPAVEGCKVETDANGNQHIHGATFNGPLVIQSFGGTIPESYTRRKKRKKQ